MSRVQYTLDQTRWKLLEGNIPFPYTFSLFLLSQCYELYNDYVIRQSFIMFFPINTLSKVSSKYIFIIIVLCIKDLHIYTLRHCLLIHKDSHMQKKPHSFIPLKFPNDQLFLWIDDILLTVPEIPVWFLTRLIHCLTITEASFLTSEKNGKGLKKSKRQKVMESSTLLNWYYQL